jgi:hypothetical protein
MIKAQATLVAEGTEVGVGDGIAASRELAKLAANDDQVQRWAEIHAKQARILAAFREFIPPERHQEFLDRLDGRTPPPPGGARLALIEGGPATDDEREPFVGRNDDDDEDLDDIEDDDDD